MIIDWIILLLMALFTYFIVRRSVAGVTTTPVWLLWLVLMIPPFAWSMWVLIYDAKQLPPIELLIGMSILSIFFYLKLHQRGRKNLTPSQNESAQGVELPPPVKEAAPPPAPVRPIDKTEETKLRNCFPWSIFYVNNIEYRPQAIICRGQLREKSPSQAYARIKENVRSEFGDRFLVLFQEDSTGKPFFALVPNTQTANKSRNTKVTRPGLALGLLIATIYTTTLVGVEIANANNVALLRSDPGVLLSGLPYAASLMTILGIHELGHYLTAKYYKIRATLPYFIPFLATIPPPNELNPKLIRVR